LTFERASDDEDEDATSDGDDERATLAMANEREISTVDVDCDVDVDDDVEAAATLEEEMKVSASGTRSLRELADSLEHGARVAFAPGTYFANDDGEGVIEITKSVTFVGTEDGEGVTFVGEIVSSAPRFAVKNARFSKLRVESGEATIERCKIHGCADASGGAITIGPNATCRLSHTEIHDNAGEGLSVFAKNVVVDGCKIYRNTVGVSVSGTSAVKMSKSRVSDNVTYGLLIRADASGTYTDNVVSANEVGVRIEGNAAPSLARNKIAENRSDGVQCVAKSSGMLNQNVIKHNGGSGIVFDDACSTQAHKNEIESNAVNGASMCGKSRPTFVANRIRANLQNGVSSVEQARGKIHANKISENAASGVSIGAVAGGTWADNKIFENEIGVSIADNAVGSNFKMTGNDIADNITSALRAPISLSATLAKDNALSGDKNEAESGECVVM